jgi:O-antigen ligase
VLPLLVLYVPSFTSRWQLWGAALHVFAQHPLLGVGPHNFATAAQPWLLSLPDRVDPRVAPWPHELYLEIAAETGLAGVICAAWFGLGVVRSLRRTVAEGRHRIHYAALAGLGGLAIAGLVEASLLRVWVWNLGAILLGLALGPERPWSCPARFFDSGSGTVPESRP